MGSSASCKEWETGAAAIRVCVRRESSYLRGSCGELYNKTRAREAKARLAAELIARGCNPSRCLASLKKQPHKWAAIWNQGQTKERQWPDELRLLADDDGNLHEAALLLLGQRVCQQQGELLLQLLVCQLLWIGTARLALCCSLIAHW